MPCDSSKAPVVWMQPNKLSARREMCTCRQKISKTPALPKGPGCWGRVLGGQQPAPPKSGGNHGLADAVTGSQCACVLGVHGRAKKAGEHATQPACLGLPGIMHPTRVQKHYLHSPGKVKQPQLVVVFGEAVYCACSHREKKRIS